MGSTAIEPVTEGVQLWLHRHPSWNSKVRALNEPSEPSAYVTRSGVRGGGVDDSESSAGRNLGNALGPTADFPLTSPRTHESKA